MKPEIKREFIKRLKTSEQCWQALREGDHYCAEGVLCQLYLEQNPEKAKWAFDGDLGSIQWKNGMHSVVAERSILRWAGIEDQTISSPSHDIYDVDLHYLNDNTPLTLKQIADLVEEQW